MMLSLAIVGVMVGLMIGRLTTPEERVLQQVEVVQDGLDLWFNEEPQLHGENVEGTVALLFQAQGKAQQGQLSLAGKPVSLAGAEEQGRLVADSGGGASPAGRVGRCRGRWALACAGETARIKEGMSRPACTEVPKTGGVANKRGVHPACLYQGPRNWVCIRYCRGRANFAKPVNIGL